MPCQYYLPGEEAAIERDEVRKQMEIYKKELNRVTDLLCSCCQGLTNLGSNMLHPSGELGIWWTEHKARDVKRIEAERKAKRLQEENSKKSKEKKIARLEKELKQLKKEIK